MGTVTLGAIVFGLVVFCERYFRVNPIQFELARKITAPNNDLGRLLSAMETAEVNGLHIHPKQGAYKTTLDGKALTLWIGNDVTISLDHCRVKAKTDESEQQVSLEIVEGDLTVSGDVSGRYDTSLVIPVTRLCSLNEF